MSKEEVEYITQTDAASLLREKAETEKARVVSLRQTVAEVKADDAAAQLVPQATPLEAVEKMWEAYQDRQSARYVAAVTGVSVATAAKYINTGDPKRNVVPFKVRWQRAARSRVTLSQTEERIEYGDRQALEEALDHLRDLDAWVSSLLAHALKTSLNPGKIGLDTKEQGELAKTVAPLLQLSISMKERLLGVKVTARKGVDQDTAGPGSFFPGLDESVTRNAPKGSSSARQLAQPQRQPFQAPTHEGTERRPVPGTEREQRTPDGGGPVEPDSDLGGRSPVVVSSGLLPSELPPVSAQGEESTEAEETEPSVWTGEAEEEVTAEDATDYSEDEEAEDQEEEEEVKPETSPRMTAAGGSRTEEDREERAEETKRRTDKEESKREETPEESSARSQEGDSSVTDKTQSCHSLDTDRKGGAGDDRRVGGGADGISPAGSTKQARLTTHRVSRFPSLG